MKLEMILRRTRMFASGCGLVGVAALTAVLVAPPVVAAEEPSGSAYALSVATTLLGGPLARVDPRPSVTYPGGGSDSLVKVGPDAAGLVTANALNASSDLKRNTLISAAGVAEVSVKNILSASLVTADCTAAASGVTGKSSVASLTVLGHPIDLATGSREIDVVGVAKVRLNEQLRTGGTLTVNAVHVIVGGPVGNVTSADIVLSQARCGWTGWSESSGPQTATTTTTTTATTTTPRDTTAPPSSTDPATSTPVTTTRRAASDADIVDASSDGDLAETGVSGVVPLALAGLVLLAGGGFALFFTKRRRAKRD
jgi:LPXTG-motif cell wall-anchored protein